MPLQPTFVGHVDSTQDALILFQAVIDGTLPSVSRRPQDRERSELVKSGSIFIFNENSSGIKRWTDGIAWSPSRILGNFLVYRQLERPFNSGEKKQTKKRQKRITPYDRVANVGIRRSSTTNIDIDTNTNTIDNSSNTNTHPGSVTGASLPIQINLPNNSIPTLPINNDRSLVGSLVDSYGFKKDGLIKKTISIVYKGENLHLVSYYKPEDVLAGHFQQPSKSPTLKTISISHELISRQHFRVPIDPIHSSLASSVGFDNNTTINSNNPKNTFLPHVQSYPEMYDMDNFHQNHLVKQENVYYQQQPLPHSPIETNNSNYYYSNYYVRNPSDVSSASTSMPTIPTANSITNQTAIPTIPTPNPINNHTTTNPMTVSATASLYSYQPYLPTISDTYSDPRRLPDMLPPSSLAVLSSASPLQQRQNLNVNYGFGTCANAMW